MSAETPPPRHPETEDYWRSRPSKAGPGVSRGRNRGLFACADIAPGELIDRAPTVEIGADQTAALDAMRPLGDFYFAHPADKRAGLMAFGLMSLLNHAEAPNAEVRCEYDPVVGWLIDLVAVAPIRDGEEITCRYKCPLWFDPAP